MPLNFSRGNLAKVLLSGRSQETEADGGYSLSSCVFFVRDSLAHYPIVLGLTFDWLKMKEGRTRRLYGPIARIVRLNGAICCMSVIGQPQGSRLKD